MVTIYLGVVALLAWSSFEVAFRSPGAASRVRAEAGDRTSTPLLVLAYRVYAARTSRLIPGLY